MFKYDSPSRQESSPEPFLTIHISKRSAVAGLVVIALIAVLASRRLRAHQAPPVVVQAADIAEEAAKSEPISATAEPAPSETGPSTGERAPVQVMSGKPFERAAEIHVASASAGLHIQRLAPADNSNSASQPADPTPPDASAVPPTAPKNPVNLTGAGAVFPYPLYEDWFSKFHNVDSNVQIQYLSIGSGGGIRQVLNGSVDFGATDIPMSDQELRQTGGRILHVPTAVRGVVPIYNVPGVTGEINFNAEVLADIYLGKIVWWDDPAITSINEGHNLPHENVIAVHRSDGNATTFLFTEYLSKSDAWSSSAGVGVSVKWPKGVGVKGDEGVAAKVQELDGAVGYVDFRFATEQGLSCAPVQNSTGRFVKATLERLTQAAASTQVTPIDFRSSITNAPGSDSYPITGFTWLLVPIKPKSAPQGDAMIAFLGWMLDHGQSMTSGLGYAPLPQNISTQVKQLVAKIQ